MTRLQICQYVYGTTKEMDVDWTPYFEKAVQRKRIPKGCFDMPGPGADDYVEPKTKKKRAAAPADGACCVSWLRWLRTASLHASGCEQAVIRTRRRRRRRRGRRVAAAPRPSPASLAAWR